MRARLVILAMLLNAPFVTAGHTSGHENDCVGENGAWSDGSSEQSCTMSIEDGLVVRFFTHDTSRTVENETEVDEHDGLRVDSLNWVDDLVEQVDELRKRLVRETTAN